MIPIFFINRDCDVERRLLMETALKECGLIATRISAVDGYEVPEWLSPYYDGQMTSGETGCSASHLVIAAKVISLGVPCAIVLEDDARPVAGFLEIIDLALSKLPADWDIVRLCRTSSRPIKTVSRLDGARNLIRYAVIPYGTAGLIVSARGAQKLLTPRRINAPIDHELRRPWKLDLNIYGISPPPVLEVDRNTLPSTITSRSKPSEKERLARLMFNVRKLGLGAYLRCAFGLFPNI